MLSIEDMPKISRRIDGLIYLERPLENPKIDWFQDYRIPLLKLKRQQHHGTIQDFLLTVAQRSEMISETYVAKFEAVLPEKQRHHFLGILSWEV